MVRVVLARVRAVRARIRLALRVLIDLPVKATYARGPSSDDEESAAPLEPTASCPRESVIVLDSCALCGSTAHTLVAEYNRFIYFATPPDEEALHADYSLCHACGGVYAARRPVGARHRWLVDHFEETVGAPAGETHTTGKFAKFIFSTVELSDTRREELRQVAARGVFVSEHDHVPRKEYLPGLLRDRLGSAAHVEILGSLLDLKGRRVLEVRSKLGSIPASLQRLYGADVQAMTIFEAQQFLIHELYGIASSSIDFDEFRPPEGGPWDLIIGNHMLTHSVRPRDFLATLRAHLTPGGHVYFYNEADDAEILQDGQSIFKVMNAFHLQTFDVDSLARVLSANGFKPLFVTRHRGLVCLAQRAEMSDSWPRISAKDLRARQRAYLNARDASLLMIPGSQRWRIGDE